MAGTLPTTGACGCTTDTAVCPDTVVVAVPGPQGVAGTDGTNGTDGVNAYSLLTAPFTMPAQSGTGSAAVDSRWMAIGQIVCVGYGSGLAAFMEVTAKVDDTHATLLNLQDGSGVYATNPAPGVIFAVGMVVCPGGAQGPQGETLADALLTANYLSELGGDLPTARANLGLGSLATQAASAVAITGGSVVGITDLAIADGGTGASTAANARTNLGLGTMATQDATAVNILGGSIASITDLAVADGGTGASTAAAARTSLGAATNPVPDSELSYAEVAISAADIDWSLGRVFAKTLAADTVFTFSNAVVGKEIQVVLRQGTGSSWTATWPTVKWTGGAAPTMTVTSDAYAIFRFYHTSAATIGTVVNDAY